MRAFLRLLEASGGGEMLASAFATAIAADGEATYAALRGEGIVRDTTRATTWPCDGVACAREVRELPDARDAKTGGARRFIAVCMQDPAECELEVVRERELAQVVVVFEAFLRALRRVLRIEATPLARRPSRASARPNEPIHLGEEIRDDEAHDVFLAPRPDAPELRALLAERALLTRGTRVLVLTGRALDPELHARYATRGRVAIDVLDDLLTIRDGRLAAAPVRLRAAPAPSAEEVLVAPRVSKTKPKARPRGPIQELLPRARRWGEVTIYGVDDSDKVGVEIGPKRGVFTAAELGMGTKGERRPKKVFNLLSTICEGNGIFVTRNFGTRTNSKRLMSELRAALCEAFGLEDDPFEAYSKWVKAWKPKFRALAAAPAEVREVERQLGIRVEKRAVGRRAVTRAG